jgi:hypothetical protein
VNPSKWDEAHQSPANIKGDAMQRGPIERERRKRCGCSEALDDFPFSVNGMRL